VDGGRHYLKFGGETRPDVIEIDVEATNEELYKDWNEGNDKYGIIKE
jgi:hypothetical protein